MEKDHNHNLQPKESPFEGEWAKNQLRRRVEAARRLVGWDVDDETGEPVPIYQFDWGCDD